MQIVGLGWTGWTRLVMQCGHLACRKLPDQHKMSVDTPPYVSDSGVKMKTQYLSRRLAKEKTQCPGCSKILQVGTLAWSHRCRVAKKQVSEEVALQRLEKMREEAVKSFRKRQAAQGQDSSASSSPPQAEAVTQE